MLIGILDCQTIEIHRTDLRDHYAPFRRYCLAHMIFRCAPYVDHDLIAGTETIILRSGEILAWLESKRLRIEDLMSVDLAART